MKNRKTAVLSAFASLLLGVANSFGGAVSWSAATDNGFADASGIKLPAGSLLLVGAFDISDTTIQANFNNLAFLSSHFAPYGSSSIGTNVGGAPGFFFQNSSGNLDTTSPFAVAGNRIYIWAFNSASMGTATQQGIFTQTALSSWLFPHESDIPNTTSVELTDLTTGDPGTLAAGADIVIGGFKQGSGNTTDFNLAPIPEPSTWVLVSLGGLALLYFRRRQPRSRA